MRICLTGPIATTDVAHLLDAGGRHLPVGYAGAPLTAVLIGELLRQGHQVVGISTDRTLPPQASAAVRASGPGFEFVLCAERIRAWRPNGRLPGRALDLWRFEREQLRREIDNSGADLVHAHWAYEFGMAGLASRLPCLVTSHDSPGTVLRLTRSPYRAVRYLLARQVLKQATHLTTVSTYLADELRAVTTTPVTVVPNPVADAVFAAGRLRAEASGRRIALVCNGWSSLKNPKTALAAFAQLRGQWPDAELHCFGLDFGPGEIAARWCKGQQFDAGLFFHGALAHGQLVTRLAEMDALLHPSLEESFGVVVAEAMALGLPVLAGQQSGAVGWVLDGQARDVERVSPGVLVDVRSASAIARGLQRLFDSDYGARSRSGLVSARSRFAAPAVVAAYLQCYQQVLGAHWLDERLAPSDDGMVEYS